MPVKKTKRPVGRPVGRKQYDPPRQLGRVPDDVWSELQAAAKKADKPFQTWAVEILLKAARRKPRTPKK